MSSELRVALWNLCSKTYLSFDDDKSHYDRPRENDYRSLTPYIWAEFFHKPVDSMPSNLVMRYKEIRDAFFAFEWHQAYDFIDYLSSLTANSFAPEVFRGLANEILEDWISAYHFVNGELVEISDKTEIEAIEEAAAQDTSSARHIALALENLAKRPHDFKGCIVESILAVEAEARELTGKQTVTLSEALVELRKRHPLHETQIAAMRKMYAYTNTDTGLRHAMSEEPNLDLADAKYMLVICAAFVNLLRTRKSA